MIEKSLYENYEIHFDEESWVAAKILSLPKFSDERKQLLNKGYFFATQLMAKYIPSPSTVALAVLMSYR